MKIASAVCVFLMAAFFGRANAEPLFGMAQVSRDDGLLVFVLAGSFDDRGFCERKVLEFTGNFLDSAIAAGHTAKLDAAFCVDRVPKGTEFDALRHGTRTTHYIFFTPNMRMMLVHSRGGLEYERQSCELIRGQMLSKLSIAGKCNAPLHEWMNEKP